MCRARYEMILSGGRGAAGGGTEDALGIEMLREELLSLPRLQRHLTAKARPLTSPPAAQSFSIMSTIALLAIWAFLPDSVDRLTKADDA